jgi:hypothetical protein
MRLSLKVLINERDVAFKNKQMCNFFRLRDQVKKHMKFLKSDYLSNAVKSKNPKKLWSAIDTLCNRKNKLVSEDDAVSSDDLSSFFSSVFQPASNVDCYPDLQCLPSQRLKLNVSDVLPILGKLKRKSCGPDGLPFWLFRDCRFVLAPAITTLFNRCLSVNLFPECLKAAYVSPIPKIEKPRSVSDYRPISMLPMLSKVFEKVVCSKWLLPSIRDRIDTNQFAYIPGAGKGTVMATTSMYLHCLKYLDKRSGCVRVVTIDLKKAFDKTTHHSIAEACIRFNISRNLTLFVLSFLTNRRQRVFFNNSFSPWAAVTSGVPQGSVLGPILFCMVVDDLVPICENSLFFKYADDLTILNFYDDVKDDNLQHEVDNVVSWCKSKSLDMNLAKCFSMNIVTKKSLLCSSVSITNDVPLSDVQHLKILGCYFSADMKWDKHVDFCVRKASRRIYLILSLKRAGCSSRLLFNVYTSCIRPILLYCFPTYCNIPQFLRRKLLSVEKRIFRIISSDDELPSLFSASDVMCERLFQRIVRDPCHPLRQFFEVRQGSSRNVCPLRRPRTRTKRFLNSFIRFCP